MFARLGQLIARRPGILITVWVLVIGGSAFWAFRAEPAPPPKTDSLLPADCAHNRAVELIHRAFPDLAARSRVVIVGYRGSGLEPADLTWMGAAARQAAKAAAPVTGVDASDRILSPDVPYLKPRLVSPDGQAAMALVNLPTNFISPVTARAVNAIDEALGDMKRPPGLTVEMTDSAVGGRDYALKAEEALDRTTLVTIVAVLTILALVYRSPVGVVVPLVSIGASVFLAFVVLAALAKGGWEVSDMERIFAVVLIFGAGVDYALFWISRYRESLQARLAYEPAAVSATRFAGPAILAGAATTICGLSTLAFTDLGPTRNAGKVLAIVLTIGLLAALTLAPALCRALRGAFFWPVGAAGGSSIGQRHLWPRLAGIVAGNPILCLLAGTLLLGLPALYSLRLPARFDSLSELPPDSPSARGFELMSRHFEKSQLYASALMIEFERPVDSSDLRQLSQSVADRIAPMGGVDDVYSLGAPLGRKQRTGMPPQLASLLSQLAAEFYVSKSSEVLRLEILIDHLPFSPEAMTIVEQAMMISREEAGQLADRYGKAEILGSGLTPYVLSVRDVVQADQRRVMLLATLVIGLIVLGLIRHLRLTLFMLLATWLTFGATVTLSDLFFTQVMGTYGLDWKVRLIVFVIVVAVGQDYNIFLAARLFQELPQAGRAEAARRAIVSTGAVISNCGLIMAATLGSLWAGKLTLLQQAGFSLALGVLIDTFFVRPILIPSFFLVVMRSRDQGQAEASTATAVSRPAGGFPAQVHTHADPEDPGSD
ncbi:MAG: MMPL family transporter [Phycisphaerae bacterium]|nr:MMPL family transporter [Phycisphaerae bacterium]